MIFSPLNSLKEYKISVLLPASLSKVLVEFNGVPTLGYIFKDSLFSKPLETESISLIKIYTSKSFSDMYLKLYSYISMKYFYPISNIFDMILDFPSLTKPLKLFSDMYLKINGIESDPDNLYADIIDFLIQNGDQKFSDMSKFFSRRRLSNFLRKYSNVISYEKGVGDLQYIPVNELITMINSIADSKIRLFIFPTSSLKNEFYYSLSSNQSIFNWDIIGKNTKKLNFSKYNTVFSTPNSLLIPFNWDEIIFIDSENDFYKLDRPPFFDSIEIAKKFFPNASYHFRSPSFKLYDFFSINLNPPYKSNIIFKKWDNNIKSIFDLSIRKGKTLFLANHYFYSSVIKCPKCGTILRCPKCNHPLSYSKNKKLYICPRCGYTKTNIRCEKCNSTFFKYYSPGVEYFMEKALNNFTDVLVFNSDSGMESDFGNVSFVLSTSSILYHVPKVYFDLIVLQNIDNFVFMDYKARDRILTIIVKLQSLLKEKGDMIIFYDSNLFNLSFPLDFRSFYNLERSERLTFKFPPYFNIIYVVCDTTQLKLDYLFGKLTLFLRQYNIRDIEIFKREEFSEGILTMKVKDEYLNIIKVFFDSYKDLVSVYVNPRKDIL